MKKLLALVLALVMTMSLVTISNAAFSDADKIDHTEAVEVMSALGVINGMPDGSFNPAGNVTRAEMAKMITIIMLDNIDADAFKGTVTDLKDINGHWAEGYIKYCYSQGVIAGRGDGTFAPNANVTAVEAAKMLLVAIGYNSDVQGYVGADWSINVIRDAQLSKFFDKLSVTSTKVLTRDEAAQMIYNAVNAKTVSKNPSLNITNGQISYTYVANDNPLLTKTFGAKKEYSYIDTVSYDDVKKQYNYAMDNNKFGTADADDPMTDGTIYSKTDFSALYGQKVAVIYKDAKNVYGIYSAADVLASALVGDIKTVSDTSKIKIDSVEYKLDNATSSTNLVSFLAGTTLDTLNDIATYQGTAGNADSVTRGYPAKLIDNDGDGKGDVVIVYPFTVEKVSYVGTKSFTTAAAVTGATATGTKKFEDVTVYSGLAKNDYVKVTAAANTPNDTIVYEKLDLVKAKAQAVKTTDGKIKFADTWYKTDIVGTSNAEAGADSKYVEVNGYLYYLDANNSKANVENFAVVTAHANNAAGLDNTVTTKLLKSDGTTATVEVSKVKPADNTTAAAATGANIVNGGFYKLDEDDDGYTILIEVSKATITSSNSAFDVIFAQNSNAANQTNNLSTMSFTGASGSDKGYFTKTSTDAGTYYINDDAVVFVYNSDSQKYSVATGAQLKATKSATVTGIVFAAAVDNKTTGYKNIVAAYVVTGSAITANTDTYGYVVADTVKYEESKNKFYTEVKFWDGTEVKTLTTKSGASNSGVTADAYALSKGDMFTYELNADGKIEKLTKLTVETMTVGATGSNKLEEAAVLAYVDNMLQVGSKYFTATTAPNGALSLTDVQENLKITKDTVTIYVNTADKEGSEGGSIQLASENVIGTNTAKFANVRFIADANNEIQLLIVDVNNDILNIQ